MGTKSTKLKTVKTAHDPSNRAIGQSSLILNRLWGGGKSNRGEANFSMSKKIKNQTLPLGHIETKINL